MKEEERRKESLQDIKLQIYILTIANSQNLLIHLYAIIFKGIDTYSLELSVLFMVSVAIYILHFISYLRKSAILYRITFQFWIIRSLLILCLALNGSKFELSARIEFYNYQRIGIFAAANVPTCLCERAYVFIPLTFIY